MSSLFEGLAGTSMCILQLAIMLDATTVLFKVNS